MAFSTAENYQFNLLHSKIKQKYNLMPSAIDDVSHISLSPETGSEAFIFSDGTLVTWVWTQLILGCK